MEQNLNGIIKYNIEPDGCLTGIFSNNDSKINPSQCDIYPEIAKKRSSDNLGNNLVGTYDCFFFGGKPNCKLEIIESENEMVFHFEWSTKKEPEPFHRGIGMRIDEKTIVVAYWHVIAH